VLHAAILATTLTRSFFFSPFYAVRKEIEHMMMMMMGHQIDENDSDIDSDNVSDNGSVSFQRQTF